MPCSTRSHDIVSSLDALCHAVHFRTDPGSFSLAQAGQVADEKLIYV